MNRGRVWTALAVVLLAILSACSQAPAPAAPTTAPQAHRSLGPALG
ncbi:MAG: hypothetical protein M1389_02200 [Chloroflexi bacterium]|nr:hypothetical protein [Chloroflexota bacterium]